MTEYRIINVVASLLHATIPRKTSSLLGSNVEEEYFFTMATKKSATTEKAVSTPRKRTIANPAAAPAGPARSHRAKKAAVAGKPLQAQVTINAEMIAERAYFSWLERRGTEGSAEQDWLRAEQELRAMAASAG